MANWLSKATGVLSRKEAEVPQTFELICECEQEHSGQRKTRPQRIICQTCGAALFVLPKNVYPKPKPAKTKKPTKQRPSAPPLPTVGPTIPSADQVKRSVQGGVTVTAEIIGRGLTGGADAVKNTTTKAVTGTARSIRDFFSPFRLVAFGIAAMLIATGVLAVRSNSLDQARETFRVEMAAGEQAVKADEFGAARDHFAAAVDAADLLGLQDAQAIGVRQSHNEITALTRLAPGSLFEMLEEAERSNEKTGPLSWDNIFRARYEGTWLVLQAPVRHADKLHADGTSNAFLVELPMVVGEQNRDIIVHADLKGFGRLEAVDGITHAIFAAPIVACVLDIDNNVWTVTLDGDDGFLWSSIEHLRWLGFFNTEWVDEEAVRDLLDAQTQVTGASR